MPAVTRVGDSEISHCSGMVRALVAVMYFAMVSQ